jgi:hypothetical protein
VVISAIEGLTHRLVLRPPPSVAPEAIASEITEVVRAYIQARHAPHRVWQLPHRRSAMSEQHKRLLHRAYEAFNARDIEGGPRDDAPRGRFTEPNTASGL